jgi:glycosyltransferase involved in cell wall biosynthesis
MSAIRRCRSVPAGGLAILSHNLMRVRSDAGPKFSVITVTFNNAPGLSKTLETVLQQTYGNFEWIVVDGKSTDGTVALLEQLDDKRFKFISEQDRGIFDAMNKGI